MGSGGSALAANKVIKNNRAMLKKRRSKRKLSIVSSRNEKCVDPKKATFEQLLEIRRKLREDRKVRLVKIGILVIIGFVLIFLAFSAIPWEFIFTNAYY